MSSASVLRGSKYEPGNLLPAQGGFNVSSESSTAKETPRPTSGTARKNKSVKATRRRPRLTNDCEKEALATTTLDGQKVDGGTTTATMTLARDLAEADNGATDSIASKTGPRAFFWTPFAV